MQPNFVVFLVDDQDYLINSTDKAYMPRMRARIGDEGLHLPQFIVSTSVCCPSRTSLLTGMFTHNHNVTSNQKQRGARRAGAGSGCMQAQDACMRMLHMGASMHYSQCTYEPDCPAGRARTAA